jgi:excisionase family DNA binding protein
MVQGYYTLEEAAQILGTSADELKQMSKRGELRAFQDRGTWRFRTQDVEELARQRGAGSTPELPLGEAPRPKLADSPPPRTARPADAGEVFDFSLDAGDSKVPLGQEGGGETPSGRRRAGPKSDKKGAPSPTPKPGSDSDVRLVAESGELEFKLPGDSDVKMHKDAGAKSPPPGPKSPPPKKKSSGLGVDSGVRLVTDASDSDVKIVGVGPEDSNVPIGKQPPKTGTDSDIRLEPDAGRPADKGSDDALLTEEIDLDAEIRKAEEAAQAKKSDPAHRALPKAKQPEFPTTSPFELSQTDLKLTPEQAAEVPSAKGPRAPDSSEFDLTPGRSVDSSSDFDLTPAAQDQSPLDLGSDEFQLELAEDSAVGLGDLPPAKGKSSGINLQDPADSGISLEQGEASGEEIEFELSLDDSSTPKPAPAGSGDSDSEFELTIDESGGLAPLEEEAPVAAEDEKDIFETDFEVPALEEESGSQAVALDESDSDLESSDFDLALSDADMVAEEESGSQVVALDDDEADEGAATVQRPRQRRGTMVLEEDEAPIDEMEPGGEVLVEEEEEEYAPAAAPAPEWSPLAVIPMIPAALILVLMGIMGFELIQGMTG